MANNKKKQIVRKTTKRYKMVTFETPIFEGEFTFPSPKQMPLKVLRGLTRADVDAIVEWLKAAGVAEHEIEAFTDLDGEELEIFMKAWQDGHITTPKS
ncbi:hypothetical protein VVR12_01810 [Rothia sp. LK2588]|uniref:hypothetical protein n=1 Tax=Rothia sp. LK2588 TaxID=3114369 RepID=UPI0034CE866E